MVTVRLAEPQFEGQTKEVLGTLQVTGIVSRVVAKTHDSPVPQKPPQGEGQREGRTGQGGQSRRVPGWQPDRPATCSGARMR